MPPGFEDMDGHRHADIVKLKSPALRRDLPKAARTSGDVIDRVDDLARSAMPLLRFFD